MASYHSYYFQRLTYDMIVVVVMVVRHSIDGVAVEVVAELRLNMGQFEPLEKYIQIYKECLILNFS